MTTNTNIKTPYAFCIDSNKPVHISQVEKPEKGTYRCLSCSETLIPILGPIKAKHFRHHVECTGNYMTDLHNLIENIILKNKFMKLPGKGYVEYSEPETKIKLENRIPDITAIYKETKIHFEIGVTSFVKDLRADFYNSKKYKCIEINAKKWYSNTPIPEVIEKEVLHNEKIKKLFGWGEGLDYQSYSDINILNQPIAKKDNVEASSQGWSYMLAGFLFFILLLIGFSHLKIPRSSR